MEPEPIAKMIEALAWPAAVTVIAITLRRQLTVLAASLGSRVSSIKFGKFQVELSPTEMKRLSPDWKVEGQNAGGLSAVGIFDSASGSLFEQLTREEPADYVVVDLEDGNAWLTSRLFFFATVLGRARGVRAFVFVADRDLGPNGFVGFATPDAIHHALAKRFPRLSDALVHSTLNQLNAPYPNDPSAPQHYTTFENATAEDLRRITFDFVMKLQSVVPPAVDQGEWVYLDPTEPDQINTYEYARWITPNLLHDILGDDLSDQKVIASPDVSSHSAKAKILRRQGDMVACVDEGRQFLKLIDRRAMLEQIAPEIAHRFES